MWDDEEWTEDEIADVERMLYGEWGWDDPLLYEEEDED